MSGGRTPLKKGLAILQTLATAQAPLTTSEIAQQCGFNRTTTYRLCETLKQLGWIQTAQGDDSGASRLDLGPQALGLAVLATTKHDPEARLQPIMDRLARAVNETVHCGVLDGARIIHIGRALPDDGLQMAQHLGAAEPAHVTALGKAILATMSRELVVNLYPDEQLTVRTPRTIATRMALLDELAATVDRGFSIDDEESHAGVRCIGVPVFGVDGSAIFAFSVTSIPSHLEGERAETVARALRGAAAEATAAFGGSVPAPWGTRDRLTEADVSQASVGNP